MVKFKTAVSGGKIVYNSLIRNGVKDAFIYSGGSVMPIIDHLYKGRINYYVNSHEQNCGHAATGYSKSSGKTGVSIVTSGPGVTNSITPLLDATNDSTPFILISGQVPLSAKGTNAFQEAPAVELTQHVTKWSYQVKNIEEIPYIMDKAFFIANDKKCGSVHIDIPKCVSSSTILEPSVEFNNKDSETADIDENLINQATQKINESNKPIIIVGQGAKKSYLNLRKFAILGNIPVTSTIHGCGIFNENHQLSMRWCGMHGSAAANYLIQESDCIIAIGSRFDDRTTGLLSEYAPLAKKNEAIIHVNINHEEINSVLDTNYNFPVDSNVFLKNVIPLIKFKERSVWSNRTNELKLNHPFFIPTVKNNELYMENVLSEINDQTNTRKDLIFTTGVGNHQMQTYQFIKSNYPGKILSSGSLGVMGVGLPYAIGAQIANPRKTIICIDGDSSFNMTLTDLKTIVENNLPIKIAVMNNSSQMMVTVWEKLFFDERYTATINKQNPDFTQIANAYGIKTLKCDKNSDLPSAIELFLKYDKGPILCEFIIEPGICLPLVGPGKALNDMILPENYYNENKNITLNGMAPS